MNRMILVLLDREYGDGMIANNRGMGWDGMGWDDCCC